MSETGGALESLGTTNIPETAGRDAIHIAVIRCVATTRLFPGQHVDINGYPTTGKTVGIVDPYLAAPVYPDSPFWLLLYPRTITGLRHVWSHPDFDAEVQPYEIKPKNSFGDDNMDKIEEMKKVFEEARKQVASDPAFIAQILRDNEPVKPLTWRDRAKEFPESEEAVRSVISGAGLTFASFMDFMDSGKDYYSDDYENGFSWDGSSEYITSLGNDAYGSIDEEMWPHLEKLTGRSFPRRAKYFSCSC